LPCLLGVRRHILRPMRNFYNFVGECYVHGIMRGEAVKKWRRWRPLNSIFDIQ
jgi:hypothetical protein